MKCIICDKEFEGRSDKRTCSPSCQKKLQRNKVDKTPAKVDIKVDKTPAKVDNDPLKRITKAQTVTFFDGGYFYGKKYQGDYYKSDFYKNLKEELSVKPLKQLREEGYYIPTWKLNGQKYPEGSGI